MTLTETTRKKLFQRALIARNGYAPPLNQIKITRVFSDCIYIKAQIGEYEYIFDSYVDERGEIPATRDDIFKNPKRYPT